MPLQTEIHIKCKVCVQVCVCLSDWQCVWNMQIIKIVLCYATVKGSRAKQTKRFWAFGQVRNGYKAKAERDSKRERRERESAGELAHNIWNSIKICVSVVTEFYTYKQTNKQQTNNQINSNNNNNNNWKQSNHSKQEQQHATLKNTFNGGHFV